MENSREWRSAVKRAARDSIPVLLQEAGGRLDTAEIKEKVKDKYLDLCDDSIVCPYEKGSWHHPAWEHLVDHGIQTLRKTDVIYNAQKGTWALTGRGPATVEVLGGTKGPERRSDSPPTPTHSISRLTAPPAEKPEPVSVAETARSGPAGADMLIEEEIISRMTDMSPRQFEEFVGKLFEGLGYSDVDVVGRSGDGGVDVIGKLEAPLIGPSITVVCQVKRHKGNVGPSDVGDLRGRWAHRADRLLIINLGGFTQGAREEAPAEAGRKEVSLVTGSELARLMGDKGIGTTERALTESFLDETFWEELSR